VFVCWSELEAELLGIWEAVDTAAGHVHARGVNWEKHLLDVPNRVRDVVELGIHHGAVVALTVA
jgi:hypothetical protein